MKKERKKISTFLSVFHYLLVQLHDQVGGGGFLHQDFALACRSYELSFTPRSIGMYEVQPSAVKNAAVIAAS